MNTQSPDSQSRWEWFSYLKLWQLLCGVGAMTSQRSRDQDVLGLYIHIYTHGHAQIPLLCLQIRKAIQQTARTAAQMKASIITLPLAGICSLRILWWVNKRGSSRVSIRAQTLLGSFVLCFLRYCISLLHCLDFATSLNRVATGRKEG